jgi:hypothetical protein
LFRKELVEYLRIEKDMDLTSKVVGELKSRPNQAVINMHLQAWLKNHMKSGQMACFNKCLYQAEQGSFIYTPVKMRPSEFPLASYVIEKIDAHGPDTYRRLLQAWTSFAEFEKVFHVNSGITTDAIEVSECYGFKNGILSLPTRRVDNVAGLFKTWGVCRAEAMNPVLPLKVFDVDFDADWATNPEHISGIMTICDTQKWSMELRNRHLAMIIGRPVTRFSLGIDWDEYQMVVLETGAAGSGKSRIIDALSMMVRNRSGVTSRPVEMGPESSRHAPMTAVASCSPRNFSDVTSTSTSVSSISPSSRRSPRAMRFRSPGSTALPPKKSSTAL